MKRCVLLLLSLAVISCAPPYSAELNSSARLAGQMTLIGTFGPVDSPDGSSTTSIKFLPIKPVSTTTTIDAVSVQSGFLVSESHGRESLSFAFQNSSRHAQTMNSGGSFVLAGADPSYPLYQYEQIANNPGDILVFKMGPTPASSTVQLFRATLPSGPFQVPAGLPTQSLSDFAFTKPVLGVQVFPMPGADRFGFLFDNGAPLDGDGTTSFSGAGIVFSTTAASGSTNIQFPGTQKRALFYNNGQTGALYRSYASYYSAGQWACYRWDTTITPATLLPGATHRIDALLTNGDLISTDGGTLHIYDSNGSEVTSLGLGGMQFCYEAYIGSTPYVFFSVSLGFSHQNWAFRVYAIPTSGLRSLKG